MESIRHDPIIYTIQNFVSNTDCDHIINVAKDKIEIIENIEKIDNNYKTAINNEWREWVNRQIRNNVSLSYIESSLKKQNYCPNLINSLLYKKSDKLDINDNPNNKKIENKLIIDQFPNTFLEIGDFFPFIKIGNKDIHNLTDSKYILLVNIDDYDLVDFNLIDILRQEYHVFVIYNKLSNNSVDKLSSKNNKLYNILKYSEDKINIYILNANRRILDIKSLNNFEEIISLQSLQLNQYNMNIHIPYILIENVLNPELLKEVLKFYDNNIYKRELHNTATKNRLHVHPDIELEKKLDNKLSRSLFPEIYKIFYFDVKYRELYKICSYDAETCGRFHSHRDTPYPHQHRKFALSLLLNEDYEGGELFLPEYNAKIKPNANTAIVFPGIFSHQVLEITKGSRKTIITFFCTEKKDDENGNKKNRIKSDFFEERKVENSLVYPF